MLKSLFLAVAAAPLLAACATAAASESASYQGADDNERVVVVNGERIVIDEGQNAGLVIIEAMRDGGEHPHIMLEMDGMEWSPEDREEFEAAMAELSAEMEGMDFDFDTEMAFAFIGDGEADGAFFFSDDGARFSVDVERLEEWTEDHAERMAEIGERLSENHERIRVHVARSHEMAERARAEGHRARIMGLRAGAVGMESGLDGIDRALERGYVYDDGERRELTEKEREELQDARDDLEQELEEFREEHAEALALIENTAHQNVIIRRARGRELDGENGSEFHILREMDRDDDEEIRIDINGGDKRVWINGEELEGEELSRWLEEHEDLEGEERRVRYRIRTEREAERNEDEG